jgi:predicted heme/steroid binding protein
VDKSEAEKILRSVPFNQGFHFAIDIGKFTGETAINLFSFYEELRTIEPQSPKFHFQRRDFQKWIETTIGDEELSVRIDKTASGLNAEELKKELLKTIQARLNELQSSSMQIAPHSSIAGQEPKKFTLEELKQYNGQSGKPTYFAFEGKVYDASTSSFWIGGSHMASHNAGKDLTNALKSAPHDDEVLSKTKQVGILV